MKKVRRLFFLSALSMGYSITCFSAPHYWSANISMGMTNAALSNNEMVRIAEDVQRQYSSAQSSMNIPLFGFGLAYNMPYKNVTFGLGLTALYLNNLSASGSESTFVGGYGPYNTLNYTAQGQSYGLFLEPKLAWTHYAVQPYFLLGLGVSRNDFGHYVETSINPESPSPGVPLNGYDQYNLAYEFGVGVQYVLSSKPNAPIIALDYRYINWGNAALSSYSGQEIPNNMSLGQLTSSSVNVNLIWPF